LQAAELSKANLLGACSFAAARWRRRPPVYARVRWGIWPFLWPVAIVVLLLTLDLPAAEVRNDWPVWLAISSRYLTDIGLSGWYLIPASLVVIVAAFTDWSQLSRRGRVLLANWTSLGLLVLAGIGLSGLVQIYLKSVFGRARMRLFEQYGAFHFEPNFFNNALSSFPSGHATTMGAVAGVVALVHPPARPFMLPFAIGIAATRVVTKAHYPSDVVAGFGLGFGGAVIVAMLFARAGFVFRRTEAGLIEPKLGFRLWARKARKPSPQPLSGPEPMTI
jgi:undecaprenyl-diphosphatase